VISLTTMEGCGFCRYAKQHPYKTFGIVALASLGIAGAALAGAAAGTTYYQNSYPQPVRYQPSYSVQSTQYSQPAHPVFLGKFNSNPYDPDSVNNPYGVYGSKYSYQSINNPYGPYGSRFSSESVNNPYATNTPVLYSNDGVYLGKLSSNRFDPDSVSNPYSIYGSRFSSQSINNPYGIYGSRYSPQGVTNPYATNSPGIYSSDGKYLGE